MFGGYKGGKGRKGGGKLRKVAYIEVDLWAVSPLWAPVDVLTVERSDIIFTWSWRIWMICDGQSRSQNRGCL